MKVLITGDKGFIGMETRRYLEDRGIEVIGYDIVDGFDITDGTQFHDFCFKNKPDKILHLAAIVRFEDADKNPRLAHEINVIGTMNVARIAELLKIPLVYASTGSVYIPLEKDPPIKEDFLCRGNSVYGCTKYIGETYVTDCEQYIILRYGYIYGRDKGEHGLIGNFASRIRKGIQPEIYGGEQSSEFVHVNDIAQANYLALIADKSSWNQAYNIGTGEEITVLEAGRIVCDVLGYTGEIKITKARHVDTSRFVYDISKAKKMLNYQPRYSFREGIKDILG